MEDNVNLWNKKTDDLTVGDVVKLNVGALALVVAIPVALGALAVGISAVRDKFRKNKTETTEVDTEK